MHATPTARSKITTDTIKKVDDLQKQLLDAARKAQNLADEEANGWQPGTPQSNKTVRVRPLEDLARQLERDANTLEELYS